jgi:hypothetical protein
MGTNVAAALDLENKAEERPGSKRHTYGKCQYGGQDPSQPGLN